MSQNDDNITTLFRPSTLALPVYCRSRHHLATFWHGGSIYEQIYGGLSVMAVAENIKRGNSSSPEGFARQQ